MDEKLEEMNTSEKQIPHIIEEYDVVVVGAGPNEWPGSHCSYPN